MVVSKSALGLVPQTPPVAFMALPKPVRFAVSGAVGNLIFFILYQLCLTRISLTLHKATVAWVVSYLLSIPLQHFLNMVLVFGTTEDYFRSLLVSYAAYSMSVALSSVLNGLLVHAGASHEVAWSTCLVATGFLNYYTVGGGGPSSCSLKGEQQLPTKMPRSPSIVDAENGLCEPSSVMSPVKAMPGTTPTTNTTTNHTPYMATPSPSLLHPTRPLSVPRPKGKAD